MNQPAVSVSVSRSAMSCKRGGYVHRRHDRLRDMFAELGRTSPGTFDRWDVTTGIYNSGWSPTWHSGKRILANARDGILWRQGVQPLRQIDINQNLDASESWIGESSKKRAYNSRVIRKDLAASVVSNYIRTKLYFEFIRSQGACIRGSRRLRKTHIDWVFLINSINS